jgi:hypothetical protein
MAERREITRSTDAALLRDHRQHAGVEQGDQSLDQIRPHATGRAEEHVRPQQHQGADGRRSQRRPDARGVAPNQIGLELLELVGCDPDVGQFAEASVDAVDRLSGLDGVIYETPAREQRSPRLKIHGDPDAGIAGHLNHAIHGKRTAVENTVGSGHRPKLTLSRPRYNPRSAAELTLPAPD